MTHFHADCQNVHLPLLLVDVVQHPEPIVWPEPDLPRGIELGQNSPVMSSPDHPTELHGYIDHNVLNARLSPLPPVGLESPQT